MTSRGIVLVPSACLWRRVASRGVKLPAAMLVSYRNTLMDCLFWNEMDDLSKGLFIIGAGTIRKETVVSMGSST